MKTNNRVLSIVVLFGILLFTAEFYAQVPSTTGDGRVEVNKLQSNDLFAGLRWRNIGPFHGGRISAVTGARDTCRRCLENHERRGDVVPDL
jgi:hypothetical protein